RNNIDSSRDNMGNNSNTYGTNRGSSMAPILIDDTPQTPAQQLTPTPREPRRPTEQHCPACPTASAATAALATIAATGAMASPTVLTFDAEGHAIDFDVWVDDLQLFLQCDSRDGVSLFDHTLGVSTAPAATADSTVRSQWTTRDAVARLAVHSHLPPAERAHFGQYKTAQSLYDAVVARYSSHATAALSRLMLPYLFPDLAAFATVADLTAHLRTSDARYRAALPTEFYPAEPVEVAVASGAARGAETGGAESGGAETGGAESGGTTPARAASGDALGVPSRREPLSPQSLCEWYSRRGRVAAGARAAGGTGGATGATGGADAAGGGAGAGAAGGGAGAGAAGGAPGAGAAGGAAGAAGGAPGAGAAGGAIGAGAAGGTRGTTGATGGAGVAGGGAGAGAAGGAPGAGAAGGAAGAAGGTAGLEALGLRVLGSPPSPGPPPPFLSPPPVQSQSQLQPASPLPGPSPYSGPSRGLTKRREPESRPVSPASCSASPVRPVCTGRVSRPRLPPVPGTHSMTLHPSTAPQRVPLPSPPASSLPDGPDPESDSLRAASPTVTRFLATAVSDPLFESSAASALVAELVDFAAACRLDDAASLVAESASASVCPPSVGGECALSTDVLEDRQEDLECFAAASPHLVSMLLAPEGDPDALDIPTPRSYAEAIEGPYSSQWQAAMDAKMASWKSTGTYIDEVPPPGANIVSGMFRTFSPTPKMTTLRVLLHVAAQRDYELHSLDFSTAFLQGSLHEEIWLRRPPGFTGSFPTGTQWSLRRPVFGLRQAPREWHDTLRTTLAALGSAPSTADPSLFLRTDATLPPFYVFVYVDDLVFATADMEALAHVKSELQKRHTCTDLGCLMYLMTCTRPDLAYPLSLLARYVAPGRHRKVHWDAAKRVLRYLCSTSGMGLVLGGRARVVLTGHADASLVDDLAMQWSSQGYTFCLCFGYELRWLTYVLTDLGEAPRSPPVLYVDNKAMLALCQEHILEHRTKHIALRYFLARELQQRGQLRLAYVASQANTADVFIKALQPCVHQPCFAFLDWSCDLLFSPTLPMGRLTLQTYLDNLAANRDLTSGFRGNRAFASAADKADWDEQNVDGASKEAGPLPYCLVDIPMDNDNFRAETYFDFADTGYATPQPVDTKISERIGPNFLPDLEAGDEAAYHEDANIPRYTQSGLQILGLIVHGAAPPKEPATIQQALGGEHREKWREAMERELKALQERNTWKVVPIGIVRNKTILTGKWVFRVKTKAD
ncbi:unnamed protein product, partial [Closterium sp. NIES-53]